MAYIDDIKLYKTDLELSEVVHPAQLPSQGADGENTEGRPPVVWHPLDDGLFVTFWKDYADTYNAVNENKFTAATSTGAKKVEAAWKPILVKTFHVMLLLTIRKQILQHRTMRLRQL